MPRHAPSLRQRMAVVAAGAVLALLCLVAGCLEQPATPPATPAIQTRKTLGQTTQNVLELSAALADGGVLAETKVTSGGINALTDARRTSVGKIGALAVEQKLRLYEAEHGTKPGTYEEFMAKIIAPGTPDAVSLPMLPYYQEWAFDPESRSVIVVEFPEKKARREQETTGAAGL